MRIMERMGSRIKSNDHASQIGMTAGASRNPRTKRMPLIHLCKFISLPLTLPGTTELNRKRVTAYKTKVDEANTMSADAYRESHHKIDLGKIRIGNGGGGGDSFRIH